MNKGVWNVIYAVKNNSSLVAAYAIILTKSRHIIESIIIDVFFICVSLLLLFPPFIFFALNMGIPSVFLFAFVIFKALFYTIIYPKSTDKIHYNQSYYHIVLRSLGVFILIPRTYDPNKPTDHISYYTIQD